MVFWRKYNTATHVYVPMIKRGAVDFALSSDWTPAAGDVKISKDGGAAANVTNLPTAITMGNTAMWDFSLTASELSAAKIAITVADAATKAVEDQMILIETYGNASAELKVDWSNSASLGLTTLDAAISSRASAATQQTLTPEERNSVADALLDRVDAIDPGLTPRGALRLGAMADAGNLSGASTPTVTLKNFGSTKTRLTATVDADGNRTVTSTDVT